MEKYKGVSGVMMSLVERRLLAKRLQLGMIYRKCWNSCRIMRTLKGIKSFGIFIKISFSKFLIRSVIAVKLRCLVRRYILPWTI